MIDLKRASIKLMENNEFVIQISGDFKVQYFKNGVKITC